VSINARDSETKMTLLEWAAHAGDLQLAKLCYRRKANLNSTSQGILEIKLKNEIKKFDYKGKTPFNIATRQKKYDVMEFLHTYGVKINSSDAQGVTALHEATINDDIDGICRLIEWGADVNIRDHRNRTPLHYAALKGHTQVAMLLLEFGADLNAVDKDESTALALAEMESNFSLMDHLQALGGAGHQLHAAWRKGGAKATRQNNSLLGVVSQPKTTKYTNLYRLGAIDAPFVEPANDR